jgi:hypothetical protein
VGLPSAHDRGSGERRFFAGENEIRIGGLEDERLREIGGAGGKDDRRRSGVARFPCLTNLFEGGLWRKGG